MKVIDSADSERMVDLVFRHADAGTYASLRTFLEGEEGHPKAIEGVKVTPDRTNLVRAICHHARAAARMKQKVVFAIPSATFNSSNRARVKDLANGLAVVVELDQCPSQGLRRLRKVLGAPTFVVDSGGRFKCSDGNVEPKLHAYYRLSRPTRTMEEHEKLKRARELATRIADGDHTAISPVHPMRCAGSVHRKGKPRRARIVECKGGEVDLDDAITKLENAVQVAPQRSTEKPAERNKSEADTADVRESAALIAEILRGANYHSSLSTLAMRHLAAGAPPHAVEEILRGYMFAVHEVDRDTKDGVAQPGRWQARLDDIPRLVGSAAEKLTSAEGWFDPEPLPTTIPPVPGLTPKMLPKALRDWAVQISHNMQAPLDYVAVAALVAAGSALGRKMAIQPKRKDQDWIEVANLWGCIIGDPGIMKSPAARAAMAPLEALEAEAAIENQEAMKDYARALREYDIRRKAAEKQMATRLRKDLNAEISEFIDGPPAPPKLRRLIVVDATQESLGAIHAANPNGVLVHKDEAIPFLLHLEDQKFAAERALFLSGWAGHQPHSFDRIVRGHVSIASLCLSVFGGAQPERFLVFLKQHMASGSDGMIQRFQLLVWPDAPADWQYVDTPTDRSAMRQVQRVFRRLYELTPDSIDAERVEQGMGIVRFTPEAQTRFKKWLGKLERKARSTSLPAPFRTHLSKYRKLTPSLALLFHVIDGKRGPVGIIELKRAIAWARYLEAHAVRAYGTVIRHEVSAARTLLNHIKQGDLPRTFAARDVQRKGWQGMKVSREVQPALQVLLDCNILRKRNAPTGNRNVVLFDVSPKLARMAPAATPAQ